MTIPDLNPTGYTGIKQKTPPNVRYFTKDPTMFDNVGFDIGDFWINTAIPQSWQLMSKSAGIVGTHQTAQWELMGSATAGVFTLSPNSGAPIPAVGGNINFKAGTGISITNTANPAEIQFTVMHSGFTWNSVTSATNPNTLADENGYVPTGGAQVIFALPAAPVFGDVIEIVGTATGNLWTITQNAGQSIRLGGQATSVGVLGHLDATMVTDSVKLLCVVAVTTFEIISVTGNPNFI